MVANGTPVSMQTAIQGLGVTLLAVIMFILNGMAGDINAIDTKVDSISVDLAVVKAQAERNSSRITTQWDVFNSANGYKP